MKILKKWLKNEKSLFFYLKRPYRKKKIVKNSLIQVCDIKDQEKFAQTVRSDPIQETNSSFQKK